MNKSICLFATSIVMIGVLAGCIGGGSGISSSSPRIAVRDFLGSHQSPKTGYGAYGYVLLTRRPDSLNYGRYRQICQSFINGFVSVNEFPSYDQRALMVTYWPIDSIYKPRAQSLHCDSLLAHYDYARAATILAGVQKQGADGPFLVAFTTSYRSGMPVSEALVLDMTNFAGEDIDRAYGIWKDRITRDPQEWNDGFSLVKFVNEFRSLINKYGEQILAIFKT